MSLFNGNVLFTLNRTQQLCMCLCVCLRVSLLITRASVHPVLVISLLSKNKFPFCIKCSTFFLLCNANEPLFLSSCGLQHIMQQLHLTKPKRKLDVWQTNLISQKPWNRNPVRYLKWWTLILCFQRVTSAQRRSHPNQNSCFPNVITLCCHFQINDCKTALPRHWCPCTNTLHLSAYSGFTQSHCLV